MQRRIGLLRRITVPAPDPASPSLKQTIRSLLKWLAAMLGSDEGRASLINLLHDFRAGRFARFAPVRECIRELAAAWRAASGGSEPREVFRSVVRPYRCVGVPAEPRECSRVMNALDLRDRNLRASVVGLPATGDVDPASLRRLEARGLAHATKKEMSNARGFAWVTVTSDFRAIREARDADLARNLLGLSHYTTGHHLVEVRYPVDAPIRMELCAPTFVEGCPSLVYRSTTRPDHWGRAVDLRTLEDGLPEAVHEACPFTGDFEITDLELVKTPPPDVPPDQFLARLPCRWGPLSPQEISAYVRARRPE